MGIEDRIRNMLGNKNPDKDILERIQIILLRETNNHIPLNYIKDIADKKI